MIWCPRHPANNCRNYAPEHRKVFFDTHGYLPADGFDVHHKDGNKLNNSPRNLVEIQDTDHGAENGPGGAHRDAFLHGMAYRLAKGSALARERGAKGGRTAARNQRRSRRKSERSSKARSRQLKLLTDSKTSNRRKRRPA